MRIWLGLFLSPRDWILRPVIYSTGRGDLFFDWLFFRTHFSWRNYL